MTLQDSVQQLRTRCSEQIQGIYNNAPMFRYFNPNNRYNNIPTSEEQGDPSRTRTIEGHVIHVGETLDGVFSNMSAKPSTNPHVITDQLPSYDEASHDPSPPYWETSVMSEFDEIYIDGIPCGNIFNFIWSALVSILFQFLGFIITYLLHTSHAAKNGSQVGLGITIIKLGIFSLPIDISKHQIDVTAGRIEPSDPSAIDVSLQNDVGNSLDNYHSTLSDHGDFQESSATLLQGTPYLSYFLFLLGGTITLKAVYDFYKVKRLEYSIMHPLSSVINSTEESRNSADSEHENENNENIDISTRV